MYVYLIGNMLHMKRYPSFKLFSIKMHTSQVFKFKHHSVIPRNEKELFKHMPNIIYIQTYVEKKTLKYISVVLSVETGWNSD